MKDFVHGDKNKLIAEGTYRSAHPLIREKEVMSDFKVGDVVQRVHEPLPPPEFEVVDAQPDGICKLKWLTPAHCAGDITDWQMMRNFKLVERNPLDELVRRITLEYATSPWHHGTAGGLARALQIIEEVRHGKK